MTNDDLTQKVKSLETELKAKNELVKHWYEAWEKEEKEVDALRSIIFGALNLLKQ